MDHPEFDAASLIKTALMKTGREGRGGEENRIRQFP